MWKEVLGEKFVAHYVLDDGQVLVVTFVDDETLALVPKYAKQKDKLLVVTEKEVIDGADVFPIEWLSIQSVGACTEGEDILTKIKIDPKELREQLEYELRSKLIDLRQLLFFERSKSRVALYLRDGVRTLVPLLRALVCLKGKNPEREHSNLVSQAEKLWGIPSGVFLALPKTSSTNASLVAQELRHWLKQVGNVVNDVAIE